MTHSTITLRLYDAEGNKGAKRRFAVLSNAPVVQEEWSSNRDIPCQGDQQWTQRVWRRIADRGYVACLSGSGQWSNRGDHGTYIGTGETAEAALHDAWGRGDYQDYEGPPPSALVSACQAYDSDASEPAVE